MMRKWIIILISLSFILALSCNSRERIKTLPPGSEGEPVEQVSNKQSIRIYLDSTLSMLGFLTPSSSYQQTLPLLERAAENAWAEAQLSFYRFGSQIELIKGRGHLEASKPEFYVNPKYFEKTYIERVIDDANLENLTVLVTDLFQNDSDSPLLSKKIKEKYLSQSHAVGVLGIKSKYQGTVYDVGNMNYSFKYSGIRPFYVLILGKRAEIERYYKNLVDISEVPVHNFVIFSRHLAMPLASFQNAEIKEADKLVQDNGLFASGVEDENGIPFKLREESGKAAFTAVLKYSPVHYGLGFDPSALEPDVTAWKYNSNQYSESTEGKRAFSVTSANVSRGFTLTDQSLANLKSEDVSEDVLEKLKTIQNQTILGDAKFLEVLTTTIGEEQIAKIKRLIFENAALSGGELNVKAEILASSLPGKGIYCFKVIIRPKEGSYSIPHWASEWDMPSNLIESWKQKPENFNGATTLNLKPFLEDLSMMTVQAHVDKKPKLAEFRCYIEKP